MAVTTTTVHVRVDTNVKKQATETLALLGMTLSDAIRLYLARIAVDQELPFALEAPNATSRVAIEEASAIITRRRVRFTSTDVVLHDRQKDGGR